MPLDDEWPADEGPVAVAGVGGGGGGAGPERPPWPDIVKAVAAGVAALALVAIAFYVKDLRDDRRREACLMAAQTVGFRTSFDEEDYIEAIRDCGYDVPDPDDDENPT